MNDILLHILYHEIEQSVSLIFNFRKARFVEKSFTTPCKYLLLQAGQDLASIRGLRTPFKTLDVIG